MTPHNFADSLAASHRASDLPLWRECYAAAFPSMVAMIDHRQDGDHQRAGIDRSIILANSKHITVDEKIRYRNAKTGKVYEDIALEFWSDEQRQIPGWVCKPLLCDYIAYAIAPLGVCYLLPVIQLQAGWAKFGETWRDKCREIRAHNQNGMGRSYVTVSLAVPAKWVMWAIRHSLVVRFAPIDVPA